MIRSMLGWILDGSWDDFGRILGPSWEVNWGQVATKIRKNEVPKRCQKNIKNQEAQVSPGKSLPRGVGSLKTLQNHNPRGHQQWAS